MSQDCSICNHPKRLEIDRQIVQQRSLASIGRFFAVDIYALNRHAHNHVARQLTQAFEKKTLIEGNQLLEIIDDLIKKSQAIFDRNYAKGADGLALKSIDSIRGTIDLLAKISYQLHQSRIAEIELQRLLNGDQQKEQNEELQEGLKCLSLEELRLFQRLQYKIMHQNHDVIRRDKPSNFIENVE